MQGQASTEDYLETILLLSRDKGSIRSKNIVEEMGFSKPSVSVAMKKLREKDLITMDEDGFITLTQEGSVLANQVYDRHSTLYEWLLRIGVSELTAAADACRMEHILSEETIAKIKLQLL
ncbi:MAG: metal-dependent transcriptional regulator [Lachnospiraceae bacterium]|jgi:Mn-dependent DtxR family transcriptional regulator|nr:metal-dependent transcriptional regulator [Lachnospiraceae bacterium]